MDSQKEVLYWSRMNNAVSSFCLKMSLNRIENEELACSILGDGKNTTINNITTTLYINIILIIIYHIY